LSCIQDKIIIFASFIIYRREGEHHLHNSHQLYEVPLRCLYHKVDRFDIHGRRIFESNDKFYFEDHGIRNALAGGSREGDIEKVIENIIYNQLVRMGYKVMVGQLQAGEIDFVCTKPEGNRILAYPTTTASIT